MNNIAALLDSQTSYAFVWTMVHSLWQCALVAMVLAISLRINRNQSAKIRYAMAMAALVVCVALSVATFHHHYQNIQAAQAALLQADGGVVLTYSQGIFEQFYQLLNNNVDTLMLIWLLGFLVQSYGYLRDYICAQRLKTQGCEAVEGAWSQCCSQLAEQLNITKAVQIKNSTRVSSICVIGHFKPVILLPIGLLTSLSSEQVEALLLHELAHISRNDYLINAIQGLVRLLYFFNPAVIWICKMIDIERENACDDIAVQHCGSAKVYANSLTNVADLELKLRTVLAVRNGRYKMLPRITRLFSRPSSVSKSVEQLASALCGLGLVFAMNVSAAEIDLMSPVSAEPPVAVSEPAAQSAPELAQPAAAPKAPLEAMPAQRPTPPQPVVTTVATDYVVKQMAPALPEKALAPDQSSQAIEPATAPQPKASPKAPKPAVAPKPAAMEKVPTQIFDEFYLSNEASLPLTRKIYVPEVTVAFAPIWLIRHENETSDNYRNYIKSEYGETMKQGLTEELAKHGWQVVNTPSADALVLKARLHTLYITSPETSRMKDSLVASVGQSGVEFILMNPKGESVMKIVDYRATKDNKTGAVLATRATNLFHFKLLMEEWNEDAVSYLQSLMEIAEQHNAST